VDVSGYWRLKNEGLLEDEEGRVDGGVFAGKGAHGCCDFNAIVVGNESADGSLVGNGGNGERVGGNLLFAFGNAFPY
jgi:hypothetical protein